MICFIEGHIIYEDRFNWRVFIIGSHVLHDGMSYRWTYLVIIVILQ